MFYLFFLLFILLSVGLLLSVFQSGKMVLRTKIFRIAVVAFGVGLLSCYFIVKSLTPFQKDSVTLQIINTLPLPLDFYVIKVNADKDSTTKYETRHVGMIRSNFYRIDYLDMKNSDQYWIAGLMGKKNLVYFSQHALPNKNEDQIIEINNYINQSLKLSEVSKELIAAVKLGNMKTAIWITLDFLLLFLTFILILKKTK